MGWFDWRWSDTEAATDLAVADNVNPVLHAKENFGNDNLNADSGTFSMDESAQHQSGSEIDASVFGGEDPCTMEWFVNLCDEYLVHVVVGAVLVMLFCHYLSLLKDRRTSSRQQSKKSRVSREDRQEMNKNSAWNSKTDVVELKNKLRKFESENEDLDGENRKLQKELKDVKQELVDQRKESNNRIVQLEKGNSEKDRKIKALTNECIKERKAACARAKEHEEEQTTLKEDYQNAKAESEEQRKKLIEAKAECARLKTKSVVIRDYPEAEAKVAELQHQLEEVTSRNTHLEKEKVKLESHVENVETDYKEATKSIRTLKIENGKLKTDIETQRGTISGLENKNADLREQCMEANNKITDLKAELEKKVEEVDSLKCRIEELRAKHREEVRKREATTVWFQNQFPRVCTIPQTAHDDNRIKPIITQFMERLNDQLPEALGSLHLTAEHGKSIDTHHTRPIILPCILASRAGSDINAALNQAKIEKGLVILVIFHHLAQHNCKITTPTEDKLKDNRCLGMVDAVFWNGNMYDCPANTTAVQRIKGLLRWNVPVDNVLRLEELLRD